MVWWGTHLLIYLHFITYTSHYPFCIVCLGIDLKVGVGLLDPSQRSLRWRRRTVPTSYSGGAPFLSGKGCLFFSVQTARPDEGRRLQNQ